MNYLYKSFLFTEVRGFVEKIDEKEKKEVVESYVLKEDKRGLLQTSLSFNSEEEFRLSSLLVLKNIFNYGFEASGYINISQRNILSRLSFGSRILPYKTSFFTNFYKDRQYHKRYDADIEGYGFELSRYPNKWVIHTLRLERNYVKLKNLPTGYDPILEKYFVVRLNYHIFDDHRDNKVDPNHGYIFEGNLYKFFEDFDFVKTNAQFRYYMSYKSYLTFTQRFSGGYIWEDINNIPISERFFLGGIGNFRGFSFEELGGIHNLGGKSFILINNDIRFPIYKPVKGFFFVDIGNVYETDTELKDLETRETGGVGLYLPTPAGAIIVDYARKLDKKKGETPARFEFQISILF
jgi:outer membrane protein insertion porin family